MRLAPGTVVGPYEVLDFLGAGGMAEVYRALDPRLGRKVALKFVAEASSIDDEMIQRLRQEARLAGGLSHPNIVAVHDVGEHAGAPYIVTELLEGETLRERLRHGAVPLSTALDWAIQMAHGLGAAHERGLIHRDLKPENVFVTSSGRIKLLDFGIAKPTASAEGTRDLMEPTVGSSGGITRTGAVLGTPGYMSPEQLQGQPLDPRSDLFSLGAILYELLSGTRAFPGESVVDSSYRIVHSEPAPFPPDVPVPLASLVRCCLEKDPVLRFQSARDLVLTLEVLRSGTVTGSGLRPVAAPPARSRRVVTAVLAAIAGLACAGSVVWWTHRSGGPRVPEITQLSQRRGSIWAARFAPDQRTVYFSAAWGGGLPHIYALSESSTEPEELGLGDAQLLSVSSKGELAVTLHPDFVQDFDGPRGTLARVLPRHQLPREVATDVEYADWAPDGERLAVARWENGRSRLEYPLGTPIFESPSGWVGHPRVAPDGQRVAFVHHPAGDTGGEVMVLTAGQQPERWSQVFGAAAGPLVWEAGGESVLLTGSVGGEPAALWRARRGRPPEVVHRETADLMIGDLSRDGRLVVVAVDWRQEVEVQRAGVSRNMPIEDAGWEMVSGLSADGRSVLYSIAGAGDVIQMLLRPLDAAAPIHLGPGLALDLSPDGRWVLASPNGTSGVVALLPTKVGSNRTLTIARLGRIETGAFFPDGKRAVVVGPDLDAGERRVRIVDLQDGKARALPPNLQQQIRIAVSPDSRWVAVVASDDFIALLPVDGGEPVRVTELGQAMLPVGWTADGGLVVFERKGMPSHVLRFDLATRAVRPLATITPDDTVGVVEVHRVRMTPDGKTFASNFSRRGGRLYTLDWKGHPP